ncbi:hypothetical protein F5Y19DRAFT_479218 [Xylariaceae sp. FL1651]|nr:hypothetical protein F5Y19DRAFT_479218 [Xylariaceae sp. FL1651]
MPEKDREDTAVPVDAHDADAGGRPRIQKSAGPKFRVNDRVYVSSGRALLGPYRVSSVPNSQQYTLCDDDGYNIENGRLFGENELQWA